MTREEAIAAIEESRQTHVAWVEHFDDNPDCEFCTPEVVRGVGDREHHVKCVEKYDGVIAALERLAA